MSWPPWKEKLVFSALPAGFSIATAAIGLFSSFSGAVEANPVLITLGLMLLLSSVTGILFAQPRFRGRWFVMLPAMLGALGVILSLLLVGISTGHRSFGELWPALLIVAILSAIFVDTIVLEAFQQRPAVVTPAGFRPPGISKFRIIRSRSFVNYSEIAETKPLDLPKDELGIAVRLQDGTILFLRDTQGVPKEFIELLVEDRAP